MQRKGNIFNLVRKLNQPTHKGSFGLSASEFEAAFQRERSLADRSLRSFSVVVFLPRDEGPESLAGLARILRDRLRTSDSAGQIDNGLVGVLLPETDERGANTLANSVIAQLASERLKFDFKVYVYSGRDDGSSSPGRTEGEGDGGTGSGPSGPKEADRAINGGGSHHVELEQPPRRVSSNGHASRLSNGYAPRPSNGHAIDLGDESSARTRERGESRSSVTPEPEPSISMEEWRELAELRSTLGGSRAEDLKPLCCEPLSFRRRALDVVVSGVLLAVLSPVLALVALAVKLSSPGPVLFVQKRAGQGGIPFDFYKFRSMYVDAEARRAALEDCNEQDGPIFKMKNDPRMTPVGRFLRRSSLDELPQLYNVLRGDMTLVGPRPPTLNEVAEYEPWQLGRLRLKGGLTCIWQVSGRSEIGFEEWVRMDLRYAQRRGLKMDLGLLAKTANAVVTGRGAY